MFWCLSGFVVVNVSYVMFLLIIFVRDLWFLFRCGNFIMICIILRVNFVIFFNEVNCLVIG